MTRLRNIETRLTEIEAAVEASDNVVYAEDSVHSSGASGQFILAVRNDTLAALAGTDGDYAPFQVDASGALYAAISSLPNEGQQTMANSISVAVASDQASIGTVGVEAGSNLIGDVGLSGARTSGGTTLYKNIDVDESEDQVKGTAGQVYWIHAINVGTAVRYLKFYNDTAANVAVGTDVPDLTFPVPTQAASADGAGFVLSIPNGIAFSTAITIAATTGVADNDSGAPGANEVIVNLGYA